MTEEQENLISDWQQAKSQLEVLKEQEKSLRLELQAEMFRGATESGTYKQPLEGGWDLKLTCKDDYKLDSAALVLDALKKIDDSTAQLLVRWKPELSVSVYKKLPEIYKKAIDAVLTIKPTLPSLELVPPKETK